MELLKVSQLKHPKLYIRGNFNDTTIKDLLDVARYNKNEKKDLIWPFPPIDVTKDGATFEILDGNRRTRVAKVLKFAAIPANIKNLKDPADRFLYQIQSNLHGLMLNKDQRDNSIRLLNTKFKLSLESLSKTFKLTKASISRIITKKQRKEGPRKTIDKNKGKSTSTSTTKPDETLDFTPTRFMKQLIHLADEYAANRVKISDHLDKMGKIDKAKAREFVTNLNSLVVMVEASLLEEKSE